ncbi:MAG TPA: class I SAM-dependent methyltransferase [Streptosporangiaceae bacterium]|jgi:SAM-dependent methyltransferase
MERAGHGNRDRARLFDREAERYDRTRPGYPGALIDGVLGPSPQGLSVLDVACGTGIAARQMARRGAQVAGVELNAGMAEIAERHGIPTDVAAFETWDPAGRTFDRVTCAQAWHWLDPEVSAGKAASVLRPGGRLCLFWNVGRYPDDLADALQAAYQRVLPPGSPRTVIGYAADRAGDPAADFGAVGEALGGCAGLTQPRTASFPWSRDYTRDQWLDELLTHSDHLALAPGVREDLFAEIGTVIDRFGGAFRMPYLAVLVCVTRA